MNEREHNDGRSDLAALREQCQALQAELATRIAQVESLTDELAETNSGVVALYAELDDRSVQLREVSELKSRFLSYMSHEFRTPLGSIRSVVRILLDKLDGPLTEEQEVQLRFIQKGAEELSNMVNDLLDLAKIDAGRISISPEWFELVDLFSTLRGMFKPILTNDNVTLIFEEAVDIPRIYTDDKKLSQILRNFISNALKFTPKGEVRVSAHQEEPGFVRFAVADTGIGIAKEYHKAVFEDFVQVNSAIQHRVHGTGLGLALSKRLAEMLGGHVELDSEIGRGSTFSVIIPIEFRPTDPSPNERS
ncbi:MAG TPA: ATP-binding protein [Candidatus Binataceae bacterium]|nr:ATP-binding protein [Candidatus Binataceae bacterium]